MNYISNSALETEKIAEKLAKNLKRGDVVCLSGELGAGKTAFAKGLCRALGVTDYVTSPKNRKAKVVFGVGCGIITFVIRRFGSLPEGVSYSILLMNIITPHLDNMFKTKPFGMEGKAND